MVPNVSANFFCAFILIHSRLMFPANLKRAGSPSGRLPFRVYLFLSVEPSSLAERSLSSTAWQLLASLADAVVLLIRSILLARLLPVESFGIFAYATSLVNFTVVFATLGMGAAFIHRSEETADEEQAAAVHFTLTLLFTSLWTAAMLAISLLLFTGPQRLALVVVTLATAGIQLTQTPQLILTRRVIHRRLALMHFLDALVTTLLSVLLAWRGYTLWALLAAPISTMILFMLVLYGWRPVWLPRLAWIPGVVRYYRSFGLRQLSASLLHQALDELDDLWVGTYLGQVALGFYSRAYTFSTYPRKLLAHPLNLVALGTYAELKDRRRELSEAFFYMNALLARSGFLFAGALVLVAPEFIRLVIGERWLPMLPAFRLMLVFALLDPILFTSAGLFTAVGQPGLLTRIRLAQLAVLLAGMLLLGSWLGFTGVALAVDLMLLAGLSLVLVYARSYADYSVMKIFLSPLAGLLAGLGGAWLVSQALPAGSPDLWSGLVKLAVFIPTFLLVLWLFERRALLEMLQRLLPLARRLWSPAGESTHA